MAELAKAKLIELDQKFKEKKDGGQEVVVQFNPESLKVSFANQLAQQQGKDQSAGNSGLQFVGSSSTKLSLQLWFDVTAMEQGAVDDVRRLTQKVIYFMRPKKSDDPKSKDKMVPPGVRFVWGSFLFDGIVDGVEESLEFFSPEGKPLRASMSLTLSQQNILENKLGDATVQVQPGHKPLKAAKVNESLQSMADKNGKDDWQGIAAANGIEDPLRMAPGQLVDLDLTAAAGATGGLLSIG